MKITGEWLSGFSDGEACFMVCIAKKFNQYNVAYAIRLRADDAKVLENIRKFFGNIGTINISSKEYVSKYDNANRNAVAYYRIASIKDLYEKVIPIFVKYPLKSKKSKDFIIWKQIIELLYQTLHKKKSRKLIKPLLEQLIDDLHQVKKFGEDSYVSKKTFIFSE